MSDAGTNRTTRLPWTPDRFVVSIAFVALFSACWSWATIDRGWYLQADISNLADTSNTSLGWGYLSRPLGGHFAPVLRLAYWLLQAIDPMGYGLTIAVRVLLQTAALVVLAVLLTRLAGRSLVIPVVLAGYALSSLTLPGTAFMTTGVAFGIGQLLGLLALLLTPAFARTGSPRLGFGLGALIAVATLASEQFVVYAVLLALLALGFCYPGSPRERLRVGVRQWPGWVAAAIPVLAVVVAGVLESDTKGAGGFGAGDVWPLLRTEWLRAVGPALIGGPFRWFGDANTYAAFYAPSDTTVLIGQVAFVLLVFLGWSTTGRRTIAAWSLPIATIVIGVGLVAAARYGQSGQLIPITPRYSFVVAAPLAMALCLSLTPQPGRARQLDLRVPTRLRGPIPTAITLALALTVAGCVTSVRYTHFWSRNPGRDYAATLSASVRAAGPNVNVYDTALPPGLVSIVEPNHHVSDLLRLLDVPAHFDPTGANPMVVTADGRLVKAAFFPAAIAGGTYLKNCGTLLKGHGPFTIPLSRAVIDNEYFLHLQLYQSVASTVRIQLRDRNGALRDPVGAGRLTLGTLATVNLRFPVMTPQAIVITPSGPAMNTCLVTTQVGAPIGAAR